VNRRTDRRTDGRTDRRTDGRTERSADRRAYRIYGLAVLSVLLAPRYLVFFLSRCLLVFGGVHLVLIKARTSLATVHYVPFVSSMTNTRGNGDRLADRKWRSSGPGMARLFGSTGTVVWTGAKKPWMVRRRRSRDPGMSWKTVLRQTIIEDCLELGALSQTEELVGNPWANLALGDNVLGPLLWEQGH